MDITHEYSARSPSEVLWSYRKLKCTGTDFSTLLQGPKFDMKQRLTTPEQQQAWLDLCLPENTIRAVCVLPPCILGVL